MEGPPDHLLPVLLQLAVIFFFAGVIDLLWHLHPVVAAIVTAIVGAMMFFLLFTTVAPTLHFFASYSFEDSHLPAPCPYKSPQAWSLCRMMQSLERISMSLDELLRIKVFHSLFALLSLPLQLGVRLSRPTSPQESGSSTIKSWFRDLFNRIGTGSQYRSCLSMDKYWNAKDSWRQVDSVNGISWIIKTYGHRIDVFSWIIHAMDTLSISDMQVISKECNPEHDGSPFLRVERSPGGAVEIEFLALDILLNMPVNWKDDLLGFQYLAHERIIRCINADPELSGEMIPLQCTTEIHRREFMPFLYENGAVCKRKPRQLQEHIISHLGLLSSHRRGVQRMKKYMKVLTVGLSSEVHTDDPCVVYARPSIIPYLVLTHPSSLSNTSEYHIEHSSYLVGTEIVYKVSVKLVQNIILVCVFHLTPVANYTQTHLNNSENWVRQWYLSTKLPSASAGLTNRTRNETNQLDVCFRQYRPGARTVEWVEVVTPWREHKSTIYQTGSGTPNMSVEEGPAFTPPYPIRFPGPIALNPLFSSPTPGTGLSQLPQLSHPVHLVSFPPVPGSQPAPAIPSTTYYANSQLVTGNAHSRLYHTVDPRDFVPLYRLGGPPVPPIGAPDDSAPSPEGTSEEMHSQVQSVNQPPADAPPAPPEDIEYLHPSHDTSSHGLSNTQETNGHTMEVSTEPTTAGEAASHSEAFARPYSLAEFPILVPPPPAFTVSSPEETDKETSRRGQSPFIDYPRTDTPPDSPVHISIHSPSSSSVYVSSGH
ncbi:hypothetical protein AX16_008758 [Volvariella volvacea WC 439]|nr:hypothetical protein AX16_008758 [Volvariella volvacea WC 439]